MMQKIYFNTTNSSYTNAIPLFESTDFIVSNIDGIRQGQQELALTTQAYKDGDILQNKKAMPRDIVVELKPLEDTGNFTKIFDKFSKYLGSTVYLQWKDRETAEGTFSMWIEGVMTVCEMPMFENDVRITFTIHCSNPYWQGNAITETNKASATIKGTAHATNATITIASGTIPTLVGNSFLMIGGWRFIAPNSDLTGALEFKTNPVSVKVGNISHLETVSSAMRESYLKGNITCFLKQGAQITNYNFSITYTPQWN